MSSLSTRPRKNSICSFFATLSTILDLLKKEGVRVMFGNLASAFGVLRPYFAGLAWSKPLLVTRLLTQAGPKSRGAASH